MTTSSDRENVHADDPVCFVFVCQRGGLEAKAVLLAASLRQGLNGDHDLVAALPSPQRHWGRLSPRTRAALDHLDVRTVAVRNPVSPDYPIGNKLGCLAVPTRCRRTVFLDSDMLMLRGFGTGVFPDRPVSAVPASITHASLAQWRAFYAEFGLPPPVPRMRTMISDELSPPYVNAGFIATAGVPGLADAWIDCAQRLWRRADLSAPIRARFLDQIALPIAVARLGHGIDLLGVEWNFPSWSLAIGDGPLPVFFHYQSAGRLLREACTTSMLTGLLAESAIVKAAVVRDPAFAAAVAALGKRDRHAMPMR